MDPHSDGNLERLLRLVRGRERARGSREGDEESVALRVDLDATVALDRLSQDAMVLAECLVVGLGAKLVQQVRRALDVREEEGDGAGGQRAHRRMMPR